jgi:hypothetical protein
LKLLKKFSVQGSTARGLFDDWHPPHRRPSMAQGSITFDRSTTQHRQRSGRRTRYLRHVPRSSALDRSDQSDTDLSSDSDISRSISTNSRSITQHNQRSGRRRRYLRRVSSSSVLGRSDQSDTGTDLGSHISLPRSNNSGWFTHYNQQCRFSWLSRDHGRVERHIDIPTSMLWRKAISVACFYWSMVNTWRYLTTLLYWFISRV